ncbi:MAG: 2-hydroxyacyl-CoA dehydratase [Deltaproteobacteria bacterium]|nr:MAG: 2-hydroxyacyl-CoA dehydratase [Deltaproteobacteria bacterium]
MKQIGFTTTVPIEILLAAGHQPVDLNNLFITDPHRSELVDKAEAEGFPRNICGWIKGIYSTALKAGIQEVIAVTQGDCSYTHALIELFQLLAIKVVPFAYPYDRNRGLLSAQFKSLMDCYRVGDEQVLTTKRRLDALRSKVHRIDELSWKANVVTGYENHHYQVCTTDMNRDLEAFEREVDRFLDELKMRSPFKERLRLGYIGVPPIYDAQEFYGFLESRGARVLFSEIQRQFSMPYPTSTLLDQYLCYTYPYDIFGRIEDIIHEIKIRKIDALIHYYQSFCHRQIEDIIIRRKIKLPVLSIEGDRSFLLDARTRLRIESFLEMLK